MNYIDTLYQAVLATYEAKFQMTYSAMDFKIALEEFVRKNRHMNFDEHVKASELILSPFIEK